MEDQKNAECNLSRRRFLRHAALAGIGLAVTPLLLTPEAANAGGLFNFMPSPADQKKVGDQAAQQLLQKEHEIFDGRAKHFNEIGQRLVKALPDADKQWDFRFHVLDSKEVNAFALPGGNMFMYTGLYEKLTTDDALAAVTGHEMTHVRKQHWAQAQAKQQQRGLFLGVLLGLTHAGQAAQTIAGGLDNVIGLKYSRGEETQADAGGLEDMVAAGYNPEGMIQLFDMLQKVSGNGGSVAGDFLSDHPLTSDRIKTAQQTIAQLQKDHHFPPLTPFDYKALAAS
jgi:predicted Zn-dependent protease